MKSHSCRKLFLPLALLAAIPLVGRGQAFVELTNGQRVPVERILATPDGTLTVFRPGQTQSTPIPREGYVRAVGIRPAELDRANQLVAAGNTEEAIPLLETIFRQSMFQTWDVVAGITLANLRIEANTPSQADRLLQQIRERYGDRTLTLFPQLEQVQWRVRIASGNVEGLEEELTGILREPGQRDRAGIALITRGDIKRQREELRPAILDYLRAVYFYRNNPGIHAEALYKTGLAFTELGEIANARKYFTELRETHPDSEFAARAAAAN